MRITTALAIPSPLTTPCPIIWLRIYQRLRLMLRPGKSCHLAAMLITSVPATQQWLPKPALDWISEMMVLMIRALPTSRLLLLPPEPPRPRAGLISGPQWPERIALKFVLTLTPWFQRAMNPTTAPAQRLRLLAHRRRQFPTMWLTLWPTRRSTQ